MAENTVATTTENPAPATREEDRYLVPPVDIYETETGLTLVADMPGVAKDGVEIRIEDDVLTLRGHVAAVTRGDALVSEFALHDFHRQFRLGEEVDQEAVSAEMKHGVLTLTLPKAAKTQPRKIDVRYN